MTVDVTTVPLGLRPLVPLPRLLRASSEDSAALEQWLGKHGWEVDPTVFMAGARGPAVQARRIGTAWQDGEPGLLILPGEVAEYDGGRIRIATRPAAAASPAP